ncbi:tetratricopeptide repeat protein, partial [Polyangium sp. 6x1]|uniref:tetratricopeptide repeat protein n=1 Tax=Polyangium sp. 6x1 TaxID=3042689 RepID=UPI00248327FA
AAGLGDGEEIDLPSSVAPRAKGGTEPFLPRPAPGKAPAAPLAPKPPVLPAAKPKPAAVPAPAPKPVAAPAPKAAEATELDLWGGDDDPGFGEIDLPSPAKPTVRQMPAAAPAPEEEDLADLPMPAKPTVRQMPAAVNEFPLDDEEEEDAALAAIELPPGMPSNKPTVRQMATPVTASLEVDLPSPSPSPAPTRAAAAAAKPGPPKPQDKPTAPARPAAKGFGEIDLPSPARPAALKPPPKPDEKLTPPARPATKHAPDAELDLPSPARPAAKNAPELDLPAPARPAPAAKGFGEIDLPAPARPAAARPAPPAAKGFGEIDLPAPARAPAKNEPADLPAPAQPGPRHRSSGAMAAPQRGKPLSSFDLPAVSADEALDLGAFGEIDLPAPDLGAFGELDLPAPEGAASFGDLEMPLSPPPAAAARKFDPNATVPASAIAAFDPGDSGELEFPLGSDPSPAPAAPPAAPPRAAAPVTSGFELDDAAFDAAFADPPPNKAAAAPKAVTPQPPTSARSASPISKPGEEFFLGEPDMDLSTGAPISVNAQTQRVDVPAAPAIHAPEPPEPPPDSSASIGDEVDLVPGESEGLDALGKRDKPPKSLAHPGSEKRTRGRGRVYGIGAAVLFAIGGGALALLPDIGPFGAHAVSDLVNASAHADALTGLEKNTQATLDEDTAAAAARALEAAKAAQLARPRHRATAAYAAFVAFSRSLRHGRRGDDETLGKQLLGQTESPSRERTLAVAAQHALAGRLDPARRLAKDALDAAPNDIDAAVLLGEIELTSGASADALVAWKRAVSIRKGARALYGLARAELAKGDAAAAEKSARAALEASPKHAGARTLLASILGRDPSKEAEALELVAKVTAEGDVRASASDTELLEAHVVTGSIHLGRTRISAAEQAFAAALKIDPRNADALVGDGELLYRSSRYSQALLRFEEAMRADETSVAARAGATKTLVALERPKDAKVIAEKLRKDKPDLAAGAYWLSLTEAALGNRQGAEALLNEAIKLGGAQTDVVVASYVALSEILAAVGRSDEAQAKLTEASAKFPGLAALHRAMAEVHTEAGRYPEARTEFEAALAKEDDLGTRFRLGITLRRMRAFDDAQKVFDQITAVDKDFPGLSLERGLLYEETGQSERALSMYAAALEKAPTDVDLKMRVGSAQVMAGHAAQAEPILRDVLKERAGSSDANHFLGRALLLKGGSSAAGEAIRFLERATEIDGNRAEYFLYVGWAANVLGQFPKAEAALKRALELDRELADAYWQRGVLLHKQGRTLDALADLEVALQKRPSRHEAHATMALCYQELGRWPEAQTAWQKAIAGNGSVAEWHYRLGKIFESNGNKLAATPELDKAVELLTQKGGPVESWHADAYFLHGEAMRATGQKDKAVKSYLRFKEVAAMDNAYRTDVERALVSLGHGP